LKDWDIKHAQVFFGQIDLEDLFKHKEDKHYQAPPSYPAITRDVSLAVKKEISFKAIKELAYQIGEELLSEVNFLEQYLGEKIPPGHRGLIFSLVYQSPSKTLKEEDVSKVHDRICAAFVQQLGASIR